MDYANTADYVKRVDRFTTRKQWQDTKDIVLDLVMPEDRVLDYGSGGGQMLQSIAQYDGSARLYGVDSNWLLRDIARSRVLNAQFLSVESFGLMNEIDLLLCTSVLGHVEDPWKTLYKFRVTLKEGGLLVLALPSLNFKRLMTPLNWIRGYKDDPTLHWMWSVYRMRAMLQSRGFKVKKVRPVGDTVMGVHEGHVFIAEAV